MNAFVLGWLLMILFILMAPYFLVRGLIRWIRRAR